MSQDPSTSTDGVRKAELGHLVVEWQFSPPDTRWVSLRLHKDTALWFGSDGGWLSTCRFSDMDSALVAARELEPFVEAAWKHSLGLMDNRQKFASHVYRKLREWREL